MNGFNIFKRSVMGQYNSSLITTTSQHFVHHIRPLSTIGNITNHHRFSIGNPWTNPLCCNSFLLIPQRFGSTAQSNAVIDETLLSKQEDPMVLKQKEELLRAFASQLSRSLKRFETSRKIKLKFILKTIYGCSVIEIKQYCAMFGIHEQTAVKDVPPLFWAVLILHLNRVPRFGAENLLIEAQSIRSMIERKTWRGLRHVQALPTRRKRTRRAKTQRKLGPVRARRLGFLCIREKKK